jgi:hypothetical protein
MRIPLRISFQNFPSSSALSELIAQHAGDLQKSFPRIGNCEVAIEQTSGGPLKVRVDLSTPGRRLVIERAAPMNSGEADPYGLIGDVFDAARGELVAFPRAAATAVDGTSPVSRGAPADRGAGSGSSPAA